MYQRIVLFLTWVVYQYQKRRWRKQLDRILIGLSGHGLRAKAWSQAFEGATPYFRYYDVDTYWDLIVAAPFIFAHGHTTSYLYILPPEEGLDADPVTLLGKIIRGDYCSVLDIMPLSAFLEFLDGVESDYKKHLKRLTQLRDDKERQKRLEVSKSLPALYPILRDKEWPMSHLWLSCPQCEGSSVLPKKDVKSLTTCTHCDADIVLVDSGSCVSDCYPLLEAENKTDMMIPNAVVDLYRKKIKFRMPFEDAVYLSRAAEDERVRLYKKYAHKADLSFTKDDKKSLEGIMPQHRLELLDALPDEEKAFVYARQQDDYDTLMEMMAELNAM